MSLTLITAPATAPLTVAEVKSHLQKGASAGEPAPTAPSVALAGTGAGNVDNGAHRVGITFVTDDGETELGVLSSPVTVADKTVNGKIAVSQIPLGGSAVTARKVYGTAANGSTALLIATIADNTTTEYLWNLADSGLGVQAPTVNTTEDPAIVRRIGSITDRCELVTGRALVTQTWDLILDVFPSEGFIEIPKPPLQSITHVKYRDTAGVLQTWASTNYVVTNATSPPPVLNPRAPRGILALAFGVTWPATLGQAGDVQVRFVCGYGNASAVPKLLKDAMLVDAATLDMQREGVITGTIASELPGWSGRIYRSFRSPVTQRRAA